LVKGRAARAQFHDVVVVTEATGTLASPPRLDVTSIHAAHAPMVWANLQRLGVRPADLDDMLQEVFVVVHQRLQTYDGSAPIASWLFGICLRVASTYRRSAYVRREQPVDAVPDEPGRVGSASPEEAASAAQRRAQLREVLDEMELEKRAVFVAFEIDELTCEQIAGSLGVPVGTVYSRLHAARKDFQRALGRWKARQGPGGVR
jgi:RNA polymerase sigma-70 factor (ECF subfamily)